MKTAIFLGAGASKADGAPLQNEIFDFYFKDTRGYENDIVREMMRSLKDFFIKYFFIDVENLNQNIEFPTFEEVLGILDLAETRNETFKGLTFESVVANHQSNIRIIRQQLVMLMAKVIRDRLENSRSNHKVLIHQLLENNLLDNCTFISTNYDILIDNALAELYPNQKTDYGIEFTNFFRKNDWVRPGNNAIKLYKLHGSLNWLYCASCNNLTLTQYEKGVLRLLDQSSEGVECRRCKTIVSPVIVPPTFFKNMSNVFLSTIWNKVERRLRNVDQLIFCGYSFPDADIHIKYLLKRVQTNTSKDLKIIIINQHKGKTEETIDQEMRRYLRFFGKNVNYTDWTFEDFALKPFPFFEDKDVKQNA